MSEIKFPEIANGTNGSNSMQQNNNGDVNGERAKSYQSSRTANNQMMASSVDKSAFIAKKERQEVERDAQLLANRIALLKQEEIKTWKKIEETKKRANEVMRLKQKNEERIANKIDKINQDNFAKEETRNRINYIRRERENEKRKIQESIYLSKREEVKQARVIALQNNQRKNQYNDYVSKVNAERKRQIKLEEEMGRLKKEEIRRKKLQLAREEVDKKIAEEEELIRQKEQEVMQMELLEMELIKKLQSTQAIQKQAYMDLEAAIQQRLNINDPNAPQDDANNYQPDDGAQQNDEGDDQMAQNQANNDSQQQQDGNN